MKATDQFTCLKSHPENVRWGQGCGQSFRGERGGATCPYCGAFYVKVLTIEAKKS